MTKLWNFLRKLHTTILCVLFATTSLNVIASDYVANLLDLLTSVKGKIAPQTTASLDSWSIELTLTNKNTVSISSLAVTEINQYFAANHPIEVTFTTQAATTGTGLEGVVSLYDAATTVTSSSKPIAQYAQALVDNTQAPVTDATSIATWAVTYTLTGAQAQPTAGIPLTTALIMTPGVDATTKVPTVTITSIAAPTVTPPVVPPGPSQKISLSSYLSKPISTLKKAIPALVSNPVVQWKNAPKEPKYINYNFTPYGLMFGSVNAWASSSNASGYPVTPFPIETSSWTNGVQLVLLALDKDQNILTTLEGATPAQGITPAGFVLLIYDLTTGNYLGSTSSTATLSSQITQSGFSQQAILSNAMMIGADSYNATSYSATYPFIWQISLSKNLAGMSINAALSNGGYTQYPLSATQLAQVNQALQSGPLFLSFGVNAATNGAGVTGTYTFASSKAVALQESAQLMNAGQNPAVAVANITDVTSWEVWYQATGGSWICATGMAMGDYIIVNPTAMVNNISTIQLQIPFVNLGLNCLISGNSYAYHLMSNVTAINEALLQGPVLLNVAVAPGASGPVGTYTVTDQAGTVILQDVNQPIVASGVDEVTMPTQWLVTYVNTLATPNYANSSLFNVGQTVQMSISTNANMQWVPTFAAQS